jgi:predicted GH43/DUF377 family glycosyl hydrolase
MATYAVERLDDVVLTGGPLGGMDLMSPFVWKEGDRYRIMVRGVPQSEGPAVPTGVIASGDGDDGLNFAMAPQLSIVPSPGLHDAGGCEDPTVQLDATAGYLVYYTGVDAAHAQGSMVLAAGSSLDVLTKQQLVLSAPPREGNIKEATLAPTASGDWRLFYEYAAEDASRIGMAHSDTPSGPWRALPDPFGIREDSWDNWHLSTGPMTMVEGQDPVMFYNGATDDARWRIGWITFDPEFIRVTGRGLEPLLVPPPPRDRAATDIAFAASTVIEGDRIALYFSLEDRVLSRAIVRRYE